MRACSKFHLWLACCALAWSAGCDSPQTGTPGIDPPGTLRPRGPQDAGTLPTTAPENRGTGVSNDTSGAGGASNPSGGMTMKTGSAGAATTPSVTGSGGSGSFGNPTQTGASGTSGVTTPPSTSDEDGGAPGALDDPFFLGFWVVDQPSHALYEATLYELASGGTLIQHETYDLGGVPADFVTGTVANSGGVSCAITQDWTAIADRTLELDARCSDGADREVVLVFPSTDASVSVTPEIRSVAGESGWQHAGPSWAWHKCPDRASCAPF
jgi:hypothetical protein